MKKWAKFLGIFAIVALSVVALAGVASAQGPIDENDDGVCDTCGNEVASGAMRGWRFDPEGDAPWQGRGRSDNFVDEDGDGVCDDFVDEDGDGVCDLLGRGNGGGMRGWRSNPDGDGTWQGCGRSDNFVDEDGDGVCDDFVDEDGDGICDTRGSDVDEHAPFAGRGGHMGGRMGGATRGGMGRYYQGQ